MSGLLIGAAPALAGAPVSLKDRPASHGEIITFADLFDGTASTARIGRAAAPGGEAVLDAAKVQALADKAGLDWANEQGLRRIIVASEGEAKPASTGPAVRAAPFPRRPTVAAREQAPPKVVKRDEAVEVVFEEGGVSLVMHGKAQGDGATGDEIGVLNPDSKKVIQAVVIGPGRAAAGALAETLHAQSYQPGGQLAVASAH